MLVIHVGGFPSRHCLAYAAGKDHGLVLAQHVLLDVLVGAALNAAQVEVCPTVLKGCSQDRPLPVLLLTLTSQLPDWGVQCTEHSVAVMQCMVQLHTPLAQVS